MEWLIIALVPVLIIAWRYLWSQSKPPARHVMTDVRGALADRLRQLAADARNDGHHSQAQQLEYQARWLRTRPTDVGGDAPPEILRSTDERQVRFAGAVWEDYGRFLADADDPGKASHSRRDSDLPFTKEGITAALRLLIDIGEGRAACSFIDTRAIPRDAVEAMKDALRRLDTYV